MHQRRIDRLCRLEAGSDRDGYSRSTGALGGYRLGELVAMWQHRHVVEYVAGCRAVAQLSLLAKGAAVNVLAERTHALVARGVGYRVDVTGVDADRP